MKVVCGGGGLVNTTHNQQWYLYQKVAAFHMSSCSSNVQCCGACLVIEQRVTAMLQEGVEYLCLTLPCGPHEGSAALCVTAVGVTPHHQETHTALVIPLGLQGHTMSIMKVQQTSSTFRPTQYALYHYCSLYL